MSLTSYRAAPPRVIYVNRVAVYPVSAKPFGLCRDGVTARRLCLLPSKLPKAICLVFPRHRIDWARAYRRRTRASSPIHFEFRNDKSRLWGGPWVLARGRCFRDEKIGLPL